MRRLSTEYIFILSTARDLPASPHSPFFSHRKELYDQHAFMTDALLDVAEKRHAAHDPVPWPNIRLKVDGADVVDLGPARLPVDRTLVQLAVLAWGGTKIMSKTTSTFA